MDTRKFIIEEFGLPEDVGFDKIQRLTYGEIEELLTKFDKVRREECTIPVVSGSLPLASEIEEKKNELYSQWKNPYTDEQLNHNDNMERYRKGFDAAMEWIASRASASNDR